VLSGRSPFDEATMIDASEAEPGIEPAALRGPVPAVETEPALR
jgi:hypothetical protein